MAFNVGKLRTKQVQGLDDIDIAAAVGEWDRFQNNGDGTVTVIIKLYKDQASLDAGDEPFETVSRQINTHANVDSWLLNQLQALPEFDTATAVA